VPAIEEVKALVVLAPRDVPAMAVPDVDLSAYDTLLESCREMAS
jgi:hypothetical protein